MKADIWMPLYIGDYLADTSRLTTEQHGAYLLLLMDYWRSGKLPDDDTVLAQICKMKPDAWSIAKAILKQYFIIENGFWVHKRVESEIAEAIENKQKNHKRAVEAANARWKNATSNATSNANAMLKQCPSPSPSPSPSPIPSTSKEKPIYGESKIPPCPHDEIINLYHNILPELPKVVTWNKTREGYLRQVWKQLFIEFECKDKEEGLDFFKTQFFPHIKESKFLMGKVHSKDRSPFQATLEWVLKPNNFVKIIEGKYK
jgi:uncharacterized protein YdaU (DUF1376 family)